MKLPPIVQTSSNHMVVNISCQCETLRILRISYPLYCTLTLESGDSD
jgi:hypothetical protein